MTLKTIKYTVGLSGIEPKVRQDGGVQGNHNVVGLEFTIDDELYGMLKAKEALWEGEELYYHLERYNGEGNCAPTIPQKLTSNVIAYGLEEWITRYGGLIKVVLVLSFGSSEETQIELYHYDAILSLKSRPSGADTSASGYKSMAMMSVEAVNAAENAVSAAKAAEESMKIAKECADALSDAEVVFWSDLDDECQPIPFELTVDDELSETSDNPVKNKAVFSEFKKYFKSELKETLIKELELDFLNAAHPVGSYYWSSELTNPASLFGGTWERIAGRFVYAAEDERETATGEAEPITVNASGGSATHKLEDTNMPSYMFGSTNPNNVGGGARVQRRAIIPDSVLTGSGEYYTFIGKTVSTSDALAGETDPSDRAGIKWILGEKAPINHLPPYIAAYCWKRTA